ncbi:helix-turn-helix domain-containing protein [Bradyrhizobium sp.]
MSRSLSYAFTGTGKLSKGIADHQSALYSFILEQVTPLDPRLESTLQDAVSSLLASNFEQRLLSDKLGVSRTTINRWANGNNIPRSPGYREWAVTTLIALLRQSLGKSDEPSSAKSKRTANTTKDASSATARKPMRSSRGPSRQRSHAVAIGR